jgi:hypothetical protein
MDRELSSRMQSRTRASMMAVAAYQRQGWSQSGRRLMVHPQPRQRKRRTQMTIHPTSNKPRTCREYVPCPTSCRTPWLSRAGFPQETQKLGRRSSMEGASGLCAQSCSTVRARLCKMTTVSCGGGGENRVSAKRGASPPPPFLLDGQSSYPNPRKIDRRKVGLCGNRTQTCAIR